MCGVPDTKWPHSEEKNKQQMIEKGAYRTCQSELEKIHKEKNSRIYGLDWSILQGAILDDGNGGGNCYK